MTSLMVFSIIDGILSVICLHFVDQRVLLLCPSELAICIAQTLQSEEVSHGFFFGFTAKTDNTAANGKAVIIFDSLVSTSVFFVHLSK